MPVGSALGFLIPLGIQDVLIIVITSSDEVHAWSIREQKVSFASYILVWSEHWWETIIRD